ASVGEDSPHPRAEGGATGLAGQHGTASCRQPGRLRRLATRLPALEGDERAPAHWAPARSDIVARAPAPTMVAPANHSARRTPETSATPSSRSASNGPAANDRSRHHRQNL